jgi:hypothetical protein
MHGWALSCHRGKLFPFISISSDTEDPSAKPRNQNVQTAFLRMNVSIRIVLIPTKFSLSLDGRGRACLPVDRSEDDKKN